MKLNKILSALLLIVVAAFSACNNPPVNPPSGPGNNGNDSTVTPPVTEVDWATVDLPEGAITVAEAREIIANLADGAATEEAYYVYGIIKKLHSSFDQTSVNQFHNASFYMVDNQGDQDDFCAFQVSGLDKKPITSLDQVAVGDYVVVCGHLTNHEGTYETVGKKDGYIYWSSNAKLGEEPSTPEGVVGDGSENNPFTVSDVNALKSLHTGSFFVKGILVGQIKGDAKTYDATNAELAAPFTPNSANTNTNILLADAAGTTDIAQIIPVQLPTGFLREGLNLIANPDNFGKTIVVYGSLEKYFGANGVKSIERAFIDGEEIVFEVGEEPTATPISVADFIATDLNSTQEGVYYELTGEVKNISNTIFGLFDLVDETGTVFVYGLTKSYLPLSSATKDNNDKSFASIELKEGDNITIRGVHAEYNGKQEVLGAYLVKKN